jgi:RNA polymerase sigma-70 factor (ECF subfamily)
MPERFESLAMPHIDAVYRAALALCGRTDQADDLVQVTYLKAWEKFRTFQEGTNCKAWLMRILRNSRIDQLRRQGLVQFLPLDEDALSAEHPQAPIRVGTDLGLPQENTAAAVPDAATMLESFSDQQVIEALAQLPPDQRLALLLADVERMDHQEIAAVLEVPVGTVKSRTSRARAALREKLLAHAKDLGFVKR